MKNPAPWPSDPEQAPTAEQIARAYVAAARELGDEARLAAAVQGGGEAYARLVTRARWVALEALAMLWPRCPAARLLEKLGMPGDYVRNRDQAKRAGWWSEKLVNRVVEAI